MITCTLFLGRAVVSIHYHSSLTMKAGEEEEKHLIDTESVSVENNKSLLLCVS